MAQTDNTNRHMLQQQYQGIFMETTKDKHKLVRSRAHTITLTWPRRLTQTWSSTWGSVNRLRVWWRSRTWSYWRIWYGALETQWSPLCPSGRHVLLIPSKTAPSAKNTTANHMWAITFLADRNSSMLVVLSLYSFTEIIFYRRIQIVWYNKIMFQRTKEWFL